MYRLLKQLLMYRIGQRTARGFARAIGLKRVARLVGIVGGIKYMHKHALQKSPAIAGLSVR